MVIGPQILNTVGRAMDLDHDGVAGEIPDDQYTATFTITAPRITGSTPAGSTADLVQALQLRFDRPMDRTSFSLADILSFTGPQGKITATGFHWIDAQTLEITFQGSASGHYEVVIGPQILDFGGNLLDRDADLVVGEVPDDCYLATFDVDRRGPYVFYVEPDRQASAPLDHIDFFFSEPLRPDSFSAADIVRFLGPGGGDLSSQVTGISVADNKATVYFSPQTIAGPYEITIGSQILDRVGNAMDQNRDGTNGGTEDIFIATIDLHSPDLRVDTVDDPLAAVFGDSINVSWTVHNYGNDDAQGRWTDYVYLSKDDMWDLGDTLIGTFQYDSQQLGPVAAITGTYRGGLTAATPAVIPGQYHVLVRTNPRQEIAESNASNNDKASTGTALCDIPPLVPGSSINSVVRYGQSLYYQIDISADDAGKQLSLSFFTNPADVANELYIRYGDLPTRATHDSESDDTLFAEQRVVVSNVKPGTYYVLAVGDPRPSGSGVLGTGTIAAAFANFDVFDAAFGQGGTAGKRTIEIHGTNFDRTVTSSLVSQAGYRVPAIAYVRPGSLRLFATFDLTNVPAGTYDVVIENNAGGKHVVTGGFEVVAGGGALVQASLVLPDAFRRTNLIVSETYSFTLTWSNSGLNDAPAPILDLVSSEPFGDTLAQAKAKQGSSERLFYGAMEGDGPLGIILPGQSRTVTYFVAPRTRAEVPEPTPNTYSVTRLYGEANQLFDWESVRDEIKPAGMSDVEFQPIFDRIKADVGATNGDYLRMLSATATLIGRSTEGGFPPSSPSCTSNTCVRPQRLAPRSPAEYLLMIPLCGSII